MTEDVTPLVDVRELVDESRKLTAAVEPLQTLPERVDKLTSTLATTDERLTKRGNKNRVLALLAIIGVVLVAALSVVVSILVVALLDQRGVQKCINDQTAARAVSSAAFFVDERNRLQGQDTALTELAGNDPKQGFADFRSATRSSLDFVNGRLHTLGVKFDKHGNPVLDKHGNPVLSNPPPSCG